jgi:hypothetical protein
VYVAHAGSGTMGVMDGTTNGPAAVLPLTLAVAAPLELPKETS